MNMIVKATSVKYLCPKAGFQIQLLLNRASTSLWGILL